MQHERQDLLDLTDEYFNDNNSSDITPEDARLVLKAIINSALLPASDVLHYELLTRQLMLDRLGDEGVTPGRLYYIVAGAGAGRDVVVRGLSSRDLEANGYLVLPATQQNPVASYYAARLDVPASYAEPLGAETISRADLLARLATRPQLLVGKLYAISRPASGPDPALTVYCAFDTAAGRVCEAARRSDQGGLWRYDLTANSLTLQSALEPARICPTFPAGSSSKVIYVIGFADQPGTYALESSANVTNVTYRKNGNLVTLPFALALTDTLEINADVPVAVRGSLILKRQ